MHPTQGCISFMVPRQPTLPSECYSNEEGNLRNQDNNKETQPESKGNTSWLPLMERLVYAGLLHR